MSDFFNALSESFGPVVNDASNYATIFSAQRQIGITIADVTVDEVHNDEMVITLHPVEIGAPITDHAFKQPATVEIRCGWSNSFVGSEGYVQAVYQRLLSQQAEAQPFQVTTGKRIYPVMLMRTLGVKTDVTSEWALMVVALCQEVIITSTQMTATQANNQPSDNMQAVGTTSPDGNFNASGGVGPVSSNTVSSMTDSQGNYGFSMSPYSSGNQLLQGAPAGSPTVESLTANQGV